nr:immunoglobulin heavy chain junction region [Macaca mulatta]MOX94006.1 immunoglobulin heavy chain junction region [Macaca mulatta]
CARVYGSSHEGYYGLDSW